MVRKTFFDNPSSYNSALDSEIFYESEKIAFGDLVKTPVHLQPSSTAEMFDFEIMSDSARLAREVTESELREIKIAKLEVFNESFSDSPSDSERFTPIPAAPYRTSVSREGLNSSEIESLELSEFAYSLLHTSFTSEVSGT